MKYQIIYADPPWKTADRNTNGNRGAGCKYPVMDTLDIMALRPMVLDYADQNCLLAMWWIACMPVDALKVVQSWGFKFKTMTGLTWLKKTKTGKEHFGLGHLTRPATENCLFAIRGKNKRIHKGVRQCFEAKTGIHSEKPNEAREKLVQLMGDVPRIELFARKSFNGWDGWGNQLED